jgi:dual specificity tyrosine-phosphorylation-regulated kinase 2/3/4
MQEDSIIYYYYFDMASASSLVSLSSVGSAKTPAQATNFSKTPERNTVSSRPGTGPGSSVSTNHTTSALAAPSGRLSPTSSVRRSQSKRLTPSSIPFFRRSSSQSMQLPPPPTEQIPRHLRLYLACYRRLD